MLLSEECPHSVRGGGESHQHDAKQRIVNVLLLYYISGYWLISSSYAVYMYGSLTSTFVAIYCSTNRRVPKLAGDIQCCSKHFSDGGITTQPYTPTS